MGARLTAQANAWRVLGKDKEQKLQLSSSGIISGKEKEVGTEKGGRW